MDGADPGNVTCKVLRAIQMLNQPSIFIDLVIGASNPFKNEIETLTKRMLNTASYFNANNMAELMTSADIGIGASGTSTWERCCVGLSVVMILADNQQEIAEELADWLEQAGEDVIYRDDKITLNKVKNICPDMIISYNYKYVIPKEIINCVGGRAINLHISYLPFNKKAQRQG